MGKNVSLVLFGLPVLPVMKGRACMTDSLLDELLKHLVCNCVCAASIQPCIINTFADHTNHSVYNYICVYVWVCEYTCTWMFADCVRYSLCYMCVYSIGRSAGNQSDRDHGVLRETSSDRGIPSWPWAQQKGTTHFLHSRVLCCTFFQCSSFELGGSSGGAG